MIPNWGDLINAVHLNTLRENKKLWLKTKHSIFLIFLHSFLLQGCFQSCREQKREPLQEEHIFIPEQPDPLDEEESMSPDMHSTQEEGFTRTPEEDDEQSVPMSPTALTDRGNLVTQENGKTEQLSRQESQTQCTDSFDTSL